MVRSMAHLSFPPIYRFTSHFGQWSSNFSGDERNDSGAGESASPSPRRPIHSGSFVTSYEIESIESVVASFTYPFPFLHCFLPVFPFPLLLGP